MTAVSNGSSSLRRTYRFFRRIGAARAAVFTMVAAAGAAFVASELTTLRSVVVLGASCEKVADPGLAHDCAVTGANQHSYALFLLAIALVALATISASRPRTARAAGLGMLAIGVCVLVTALVRDLPTLGQTGVVGASFSQAKAVGGPSLWFELAGACLALLAGTVTVLLRPLTSR